MPKPNKGATQEEDLLKDLDPEGGENGENGGSGTAEVAVRGRGRTVGDALRKAGLKGPLKDLKGKFNDLLRDPKNKIVASRIFPRQMRNPADGKSRDCSDVVDMPPPLTLEEIVSHLREEYGGKKWNVTVLDEDGDVLDRRNVDVPGDPKFIHRPEDDFQIPGMEEFGNAPQPEEPEIDPMDREINNQEKQSRLLMLERQNAQLRTQVAEAGGNGKKNGEIPVADQIEAALAKQDARHRAELADRDKKAEMTSLESRLTSDSDRRFNEMKSLIESVKAGNPAQGNALTELGHKMEMLQTSIDNKIEKTLGQYKELTNTQINALEKGMDSKLNSITASLAAIQNRPHEENPMKAMIPLITSSIERSTSGYKEMMTPLLNHMTAKQEAASESQSSPLEDTLETLGKFNLLGDRKSGDFGARVVDFAEKMGPEIMAFIRDEKRAGRDVTENAIKNHLKLQAEKISRDVSAAAQQEIRKIRAESQSRPGLPAPTAQTTSHQGRAAPSMVGQMSPEEIAQRNRPNTTAPVAPPAPIPMTQVPQPAAAPSPGPANPPSQRVQPPVESDSDGGEEEEDGPELTVEEEMSARVDSVLTLLEREMKVRPRNITWPNVAWDDLPGTVLDQIIFASDEEGVYEAIKPYADPDISERVWALVRSSQQSKDFIVAGINLIKGWAIELQEKQKAALEADQSGAAPEATAQEGA
jgi:hypothetical protein